MINFSTIVHIQTPALMGSPVFVTIMKARTHLSLLLLLALLLLLPRLISSSCCTRWHNPCLLLLC
jgi:hypothetical protein